jgi:hypothetical protein
VAISFVSKIPTSFVVPVAAQASSRNPVSFCLGAVAVPARAAQIIGESQISDLISSYKSNGNGMTISIEQGDSFCCQTFAGITMRDLPEPIEIEPRLWASKGLPVQPGEHWERWLGELAFRPLRTALVLTAIANTPGLIINSELQGRLDLVTIGLVLQGVPNYRESFFFAGANAAGEAEPRRFSRARVFYPSWKMQPLIVGLREIERAVDLANKLALINQHGEAWRRLRRAIDALTKGSAEPKFQDGRLHDFVRCLEGLIAPDQGSTRNQFIHRAQTFACASEAAKTALGQIYDIRSQTEHLHMPTDPLPGTTTEERETLLFKRVRQADELARFAVRRVLDEPTLTCTLMDDVAIEAFWHQPDHERVATWGDRLDLDSIP